VACILYAFKSEHGLQSHYRQSPDHHVCMACGYDFDDEDELWEHAEEDHNACPQCHEVGSFHVSSPSPASLSSDVTCT